MVRVPPGYNRRAGGWPPGWVVPAGQHVARPVLPLSVDPRHYTTPAQVPIGPYGFAQGIVQGFATASGTRTSPPAPFSLIFQTGILPPGTYTVNWSVSLAGTIGAAEAGNFILNLGPSIFLANSVNAAAAGSYAQASVTFTTPGGLALLLLSGGNNATAGAVYGGTISGASTPLTLHVGPAGFRTAWDLAQASIGTTTGANDTSTAEFFAQPYGPPSPAFQVGQSYAAGGDQVAFPGIKLVTGEFLFVTWSGANAGDTATLILSGNQTVLT
jgi:hypothetical protein